MAAGRYRYEMAAVSYDYHPGGNDYSYGSSVYEKYKTVIFVI